MRLWSIHPKYLDAKGLVALWREGLLAKCVLEGKTKGYMNHPQLERFKKAENSISSINNYLCEVYREAERRGYKFEKTKINFNLKSKQLEVSTGQIEYEMKHLLKKLIDRDKTKYYEIVNFTEISTHPLFRLIEGKAEKWEKVK